MTEETAIATFIQRELIRNVGGSGIGLHPDDNLIENGTIDSLGIIKLVAWLEKSFAVKVADEELLPDNFENIRTISSFVRGKLSVKPGRNSAETHYLHHNA